MDRTEAKRRAEIMLAWADGAIIQYRMPEVESWIDSEGVENHPMGNLEFNFRDIEYRLKPREPRSIWAIFPVGKPSFSTVVYNESDAREICATWNRQGTAKYEVAKMAEVFE